MTWFVLVHLVGFLVAVLTGPRRSADEKDMQILLLQHQLRLLQRERPQPSRLSRWEKLTLAVLTAKLAGATTGPRTALDQMLLLFKPETILKWHRELVRRLARENAGWGCSRIQGELLKLGYILGRSTVRDVLKRHRVPPAPQRR